MGRKLKPLQAGRKRIFSPRVRTFENVDNPTPPFKTSPMQTTFRSRLGAAAIICLLASAATPRAAEFPLRDGDTWVMAGDSITAQHLHSNYYEAYCFARYPKLTFRFRNSGVGGDTIPK